MTPVQMRIRWRRAIPLVTAILFGLLAYCVATLDVRILKHLAQPAASHRIGQ
jgi:hypothetical protein